MVHQAATALHRLHDGPVELVLTPDDLGRLRFEMTMRGDQVTITLAAERPETLDLMRRNADHLLIELRNAGFSAASLSYGQWGQNPGQSPGHPPQAATMADITAPVAADRPLPQANRFGGASLNLRL